MNEKSESAEISPISPQIFSLTTAGVPATSPPARGTINPWASQGFHDKNSAFLPGGRGEEAGFKLWDPPNGPAAILSNSPNHAEV